MRPQARCATQRATVSRYAAERRSAFSRPNGRLTLGQCWGKLDLGRRGKGRVHTRDLSASSPASSEAERFRRESTVTLLGGSAGHVLALQMAAGNRAVAGLLRRPKQRTAGNAARRVLGRNPNPQASGQTVPASPGPTGANFTAGEAALLAQARTALQPKGNAIVGVLIPEGGKPIFLQSGGGQGFSSHIEGKATTVMREQGIMRARLLIELEPCQICDRSTYPGPDVPSQGVTGTAGGKRIPLQTSKINTALPAGTKLTVVGPESTGIYEGVGPKVSPKAPVVPPVSDPHPDPGPVKTPPPKATPPATVPAPKAEPVPKATAPAKPTSPFKSGLKAGGKALGWALLFAGLDYLALQQLVKDVEAQIDTARPHMLKWAEREKARTPDKPVFLMIKVRFDDYTRYMPLMGWLPDRKMFLAGVAITAEPVDPPKVEVDDHSLDFFRPGQTIVTTYTELLIP
jgi:hypothetical protein